MDARNTRGSYARLFKEVYEISKLKGSGDLSDCQINHSLNSMRRVFEEYLSFKTKNILLPQASNFEQIKGIYINSRSVDGMKGSISSRYEPRLRALLSEINIGSHRITNVDGKSKIIEYANTLMLSLIHIFTVPHGRARTSWSPTRSASLRRSAATTAVWAVSWTYSPSRRPLAPACRSFTLRVA